MAALLLRVDQAGTSRVLSFKSTPVRLGRDKSNECRLEFPFVSRTHATIDIREGRVVLRDEHSRQGTWSLDRSRRLVPGRWESLEAVGHAFRIGAIELRVEGWDQAGEPFANEVANLSPPEGEAEALEVLAANRREQVVVTTMGSVALWPQLSHSPLDFHYLPSSMGQGVPVGLGLCLAQRGAG